MSFNCLQNTRENSVGLSSLCSLIFRWFSLALGSPELICTYTNVNMLCFYYDSFP